MAHSISLPLGKEWTIEQEVVVEEGEEVLTYYATPKDPEDEELQGASIELYVGKTPEDSDAKLECINSYIETIGLDDEETEENVPVKEIPFLEQPGWYYDAQDDAGEPIILICVEPVQGVLLLAILSHRDEEKLDELITFVDENLQID